MLDGQLRDTADFRLKYSFKAQFNEYLCFHLSYKRRLSSTYEMFHLPWSWIYSKEHVLHIENLPVADGVWRIRI